MGDYDVAITTPVFRYRHYSSEVRAERQKEKRNRKSQAAVANTFQPLDDLKGWEEYLGKYEPVIVIQASPKLKETSLVGILAGDGGLECPANLVPVDVRQTGMRGA